MEILPKNWSDVFVPEYPLIELIARGFILYFIILFMFRVLPRRTTAELGSMDIVFILLLTEAASHALGDFTTIGDGIIMMMVFLLCNYGVNQLTFRVKFLQKLFTHSPVPIIRDGKMLRGNMRKELLTKDELIANLRENGIEDISEVKNAYVEGEGNITFIKYDKGNNDQEKPDNKHKAI